MASTSRALSDEFTSWGSSAIEPLLNLLNHKHITVRRYAIEILGHIGDSRVIDPLTELSQTDEQVSDSAIRALQKRGSEAVPSLIKIAESGDTSAISSLGFMGDPRALAPFTLFLEDDNKKVCAASITGFGNLHHENVKIPESVVEKLINLIDSQDKEIRETTITVLGQIGAIQAVEPIIEFLEITIKDEEILDWDNPNHYSYQYAIRALGNIGDKRALDILLKVPNKHYSEVDAVFYALGDLGDKRAVAPLLKILEKEKDPSILNSITQALQKLGHEVE